MVHKRLSSKPLVLYLLVALASFLFGYDTGNIAGALLFIKVSFHLGPLAQGWLVSSVLVGAVVGAWFGGSLADRFGRRRIIFFTAVLFLCGALGSALSPSFAVLIGFRLILGLAVGSASSTVNVYLSELAPTKARGAVTALGQLLLATGILCGYSVDAVLGPYGAWRWMIGLGAIPAVILLAGIPWLPETPRWLVKRGRHEDAIRVLRKFSQGEDVADKLAEIVETVKAEGTTAKLRLRELFRPGVRRFFIIALILGFFQQATGINTIVYYAPTILTHIGFGKMAALIAVVGLGAWTLLATFACIYWVDKAGRRKLLVIGAAGFIVSMVGLGVISVLGSSQQVTDWLAVVCLMIFKGSFSISWGAIFSILVAEMFPLYIRGLASGVVLAVQWVFNVIVSLTFPVLLSLGSGAVFFIYGAVAVAALIFVLRWIPETTGKSLECIEAEMRMHAVLDAGGERKVYGPQYVP